MSARAQPSTERLPVDAAAIERELACLWKSAGADQGQGLVTRACAWNVVAHTEHRTDREGFTGADALFAAVQALPQLVASRTLILQTGPEEPGRPPLESWISANCSLATGGKYVCSEEVTFSSRGAGDRHLPGLVRALTVPDVPAALLIAGVPPPDDPVIASLLESCDRLITDSDRSLLDAPLTEVHRAARQMRLGAIDLGWLDTRPLRLAIVDALDRAGEETVCAIRRIEVRAPAQSGRLLLAWIAGAFGVTSMRAAGTCLWEARTRAGETIELTLQVRAEPEGVVFENSRRIETPAGERQTHLQRLARALSSRREDRAFESALELARNL